jgi:hypothetical protein
LETQPRTPKPGTGHYIWCRPWRVRTFFFFLNSRKSHLPKTYFMGPGKRVKPGCPRLLQVVHALTQTWRVRTY